MGNTCTGQTLTRFPYAVMDEEGKGWATFKSTYSDKLLTSHDCKADPRQNFVNTVETYPDCPALGTRKPLPDGTLGDYEFISYKQAGEMVDQLASGLVNLGAIPEIEFPEDPIQKLYKFIGISSRNRMEYFLCIQAAYRQGITLVPIYDTLGPHVIDYVINQTKLTTVFAEGKKIADILNAAERCPSLEFVVSFEKTIPDELREVAAKLEKPVKLLTFEEVLASGAKNVVPPAEYDVVNTVNTICYTSGTTGNPKGAVLTHGNIMAMNAALVDVFAANQMIFTPDDTHISYLPYAHILERAVTEAFVQGGSAIAFYQGDPLKLVDDIKLARPTIFISVPRLLNRVYEKLVERTSALTGLKKALFNSAFSTKLEKLKRTGDPTHMIWDRLVFAPMREALGGRVRLLFSGSAPMSPNVIDFLKIAFCCPFLEGYGLTETVCAGGITHYLDPEAGHVGGLLGCLRLKVIDVPEMGYHVTHVNEKGIRCPRGELCFKGDAILKNYFCADDKFEEAVKDGWLHTGDVAEITPTGAIRIIDRAKNIFKLCQGEYVAPEKIENVHIQAPAVAQSFVFGYSTKRFVVAMIVPNWDDFVKGWAAEQGKEYDPEVLKDDPELIKEIAAQISEAEKKNGLLGFETAKAISLHTEPFSIENDLLTPSFKLKRHIARETFKDAIDAMYEKLGE